MSTSKETSASVIKRVTAEAGKKSLRRGAGNVSTAAAKQTTSVTFKETAKSAVTETVVDATETLSRDGMTNAMKSSVKQSAAAVAEETGKKQLKQPPLIVRMT